MKIKYISSTKITPTPSLPKSVDKTLANPSTMREKKKILNKISKDKQKSNDKK
jgi:hypothetical protein